MFHESCDLVKALLTAFGKRQSTSRQTETLFSDLCMSEPTSAPFLEEKVNEVARHITSIQSMQRDEELVDDSDF